MITLLLIPVSVVYLLVVASLCLYGLNFYYMTYLSLTKGREKTETPPVTDWPVVTVQLPIYNEMYVAKRVIEAAAAMDYPHDRLEIQVLDDSTDETADIAAETVHRLAGKGIDIRHVRRVDRDGYKAGALRDGLEAARGEFMAIFDADFIPTPQFLKETIPHFADPSVGFVQARWDHANRDYSPLTYIQSLSIDGHFMVEQLGRSSGGYWFNFNGTAGIWRRSAIEQSGGWQPHTLTEDLDLSYRAFLSGWNAVFVRDLAVPAELPMTFTAYRRQQHRWARGSLENATLLIPQIWRGSQPLRLKVEASLHLTGYVVHLLLFTLSLIYPMVVVLSGQYPGLLSLFGLEPLFAVTAFAPTILFLTAQHQLDRPWYKMIPSVIFITVFGSGMMINTVRAAIDMITDKQRVFQRTPKYGITERGQSWRKRRYLLQLDRIVFWEIAFGCMNVVTCVLAISHSHWFTGFYGLTFAAGLFYNAIYTIYQSISIKPVQTSPPPPVPQGEGRSADMQAAQSK
jgi:cellulose synthase/poly-beta-1,6-N-acetylglucosamine synthase-like glycosyltransferase